MVGARRSGLGVIRRSDHATVADPILCNSVAGMREARDYLFSTKEKSVVSVRVVGRES